MSKQRNKIPVTAEQREALDKYQRDFNKAMPHIAELASAAKNMHQAMLDAPVWSVNAAPTPEAPQPGSEMWSVGHAKVNYVDHIKTANDEGTQDK
jgi:hypothetical protein